MDKETCFFRRFPYGRMSLDSVVLCNFIFLWVDEDIFRNPLSNRTK